ADPRRPVPLREFFSSHTRVARDMLGAEDLSRVLTTLGIESATFTTAVEDRKTQADSLFLLRHVLMNPWLLESVEGKNPLDRYLEYLERLILAELELGAWRDTQPGAG
ncbi:MAG TPA: hypothetical protein VKP66_08345, partial [Steroidobacteraceae bacterium]|nr:hypothetical protein [Steroidobacteraceae bacterium]